jgi:PAS domain S-box-containing protein
MKDAYAAVAPRDDSVAAIHEREDLEELFAEPSSERLVIGLGLRVAELRQMNLELRDALGALHDRYELGADRYEFAPVACCGLDAAGTITDINVAGAALLGSEIAAIVGRPLTAFVVPADCGTVREHIRGCAAQGVRSRTEARVLGEEGTETAAQIISCPFRSGDGRLTLVTVIVDSATPRTESGSGSLAGALDRQPPLVSLRADDRAPAWSDPPDTTGRRSKRTRCR